MAHPRRVLLSLAAAASALLAGCSLPIAKDQEEAKVVGEADGYTPLSRALLVYVVTPGGTVRHAQFDREAWHVAGLERALHRRLVVEFSGPQEAITSLLHVHSIRIPSELERYRYDRMDAPRESRAAMDGEWDAVLAALGEGVYVPLTPEGPGAPRASRTVAADSVAAIPGSAASPP